jgi:glycerate kinase
MRILIAPDKFRGSLSARQAARAIADGIATVDPAITAEVCPVADGGEGFVEALVAATNGHLVTRRVTGPLPEMKVDATFGFLGDGTTAVIEMSAASGLALLNPEDRNPLYTTTFGTGELLNAAIELGAKQILLGIGGSATTDGGIGCAQATGHTVILDDETQATPTEPLVGADVERVVLVKRHRGETTDRVPITVACDVTNPLFGPIGCAPVFSAQKGAAPEEIQRLDRALEQLATRTGKLDAANTPGAGAAGGLGFGLLAFFGAKLRPGTDIVLEATRFNERVKSADLCITGEGKLDPGTAHGKTVAGVARACRAAGVPCIAIAGTVDDGCEALYDVGVTAFFSICDRPMTLEEAQHDAAKLLTATTANVIRVVQSLPITNLHVR